MILIKLRRVLLATLIMLLTVIADQLFKAMVVSNLNLSDRKTVVPGLEIVYVKNSGVAFGIQAGSKVLLIGVTVVIVIALVLLFLRRLDHAGLWLPTGLIVGGAFSNLADRVYNGFVVDYIDPALWPAFNVADIAIVVGVIMLVIEVVFKTDEGRKKDQG